MSPRHLLGAGAGCVARDVWRQGRLGDIVQASWCYRRVSGDPDTMPALWTWSHWDSSAAEGAAAVGQQWNVWGGGNTGDPDDDCHDTGITLT